MTSMWAVWVIYTIFEVFLIKKKNEFEPDNVAFVDFFEH